jgi:hypothetical protein
VVGGGAALAWARRFPDNPFAVPTTVAAEAPLALAHGLAAAAAERALGEARLLRRARLELERPAEARAAAETLASLTWNDLEPGERARATPVVVVIDEAAPAPELERAWALLGGELPVAVVTVVGRPGAPSAWAALAYAATGGVIAHATIAAAAPLDAGALGFAAGDGAALLRVLAPARAAGDGVLKSWSRARGAVEAREFPLGCRVAAVHPAPTAPRADVVAEAAASERRHAAELALLAARHAAELAGLEAELRGRLAERARARLAELAARRPSQPGAREAS